MGLIEHLIRMIDEGKPDLFRGPDELIDAEPNQFASLLRERGLVEILKGRQRLGQCEH